MQPWLENRYSMKWDGEWHITYEVFRDLGIAFAGGARPHLRHGGGLVQVVPDAAGHPRADPALAHRASCRAMPSWAPSSPPPP